MSRIAKCFAGRRQGADSLHHRRRPVAAADRVADARPGGGRRRHHRAGVPFSDPMADGPVIQRASERALVHKVGLRQVLQLVAEFRRDNDHTPVVLMGYLNPVFAMGYQDFAAAAKAAGVDGVLTVDSPPEESADLSAALSANGLDPVFLIAPTTPPQRVAEIAKLARGYVYYVSLKG